MSSPASPSIPLPEPANEPVSDRATIVLADHGLAFDGLSVQEGPLGGSETAFVRLAEALAALGYRVLAFTRGGRHLTLNGVVWNDGQKGLPARADLFIANRSDKLLWAVPGARKVAFWIHNPARYLLKWRYLWKLALRRPALVLLSDAHAATCPSWVIAGQRHVIGHGIDQPFLTTPPATVPPPPRALFVSNPLHGLDWLLDVWETLISPAVPEARLDLYSGGATYRASGDKAEKMEAILQKARSLAARGVHLREPLAKPELAQELATARVLLYRGEPGEAYCLAVAEAQAMGVPAVVTAVGALPERVQDGRSGFVVPADDREAFAAAAIRLLREDTLWQAQHRACLEHQRTGSWMDTAAAFARLLP